MDTVLTTGLYFTLIEATGKENTSIFPEKSTWFNLQKSSRFAGRVPAKLKGQKMTLKRIQDGKRTIKQFHGTDLYSGNFVEIDIMSFDPWMTEN